MKEYVSLKIKEKIGIIEFFHPLSNSLPGKILSKITENIIEAGRNDNISVIILQSGGDRTFCAGASFDELLNIDNEKNGERFFSGFANVINAARKCPKFIIGRIQGKAVGGGVGMASACDYCFATKYASAKLSELALGIGPFVVGPAVEHKIGNSAFASMSINPRKWFSANWLREKGLYSEIFESTELMDKEITRFTKELTYYNPDAMLNLKSIIWENTNHWDKLLKDRALISGRLILSEFSQKTIMKFREK